MAQQHNQGRVGGGTGQDNQAAEKYAQESSKILFERSDGPTERVDSYGRKMWDREFFSKRATEKKKDEDDDDLNLLPAPRKEKVYPAAHLRKPLQSRPEIINLEKELGKSKVVTAQTPKMYQGGYWCEVCECLIKDSQAYLDHINGKKHNRLLGMTMRVEHVSVDTVKKKLHQLYHKKLCNTDAEDDLEIQQRLKALREREEEKHLKRKERKKRKTLSGIPNEKVNAIDGKNSVNISKDPTGIIGEDKDDEKEQIDTGVDDEESKLRIAMGLPIGFSGQ
ncbi:hypothetical protein IE077_004420 [Cardiosporidium cionae]|uniref:U1-type domain-containing protein n=1 Tax=Cardiosporidium cionae TaxID=476202 RepID=A0ABQ7JFE1_9APIC|nr:hypothetical protein IE077_004420 [Cardiosporidium cionae]|eukprot:KAF8822758.1 hypothetical protein IE077_004420 [Cardiosporidium cionae]